MPHKPAQCPIFHQAPRFDLGEATETFDLDAALVEDAQDALVVARERILLHGVVAFELGQGEVERGDDGAVGLRRGGQDEAGVGEREGAGEVVEEPFDEGELVRVDRLVRGGDVVRVPHRVREAVHAEEQRGSAGQCEFPVELFEDGPGVL